MNDTATLVIPLGFIILGGILCWYMVTAKGDWRLKLLLGVTVPAFGLIVWASIPSYLGWPTGDTLPDEAVLVWVDIREPGVAGSGDGAIYLWLISLDDKPVRKSGSFGYTAATGTPRAYVMPYSRKAHEALHAAREAVRAGETVILGRKGKGGKGASAAAGERPSGGGSSDYEFDDYMIYEQPEPQMPRKDGIPRPSF